MTKKTTYKQPYPHLTNLVVIFSFRNELTIYSKFIHNVFEIPLVFRLINRALETVLYIYFKSNRVYMQQNIAIPLKKVFKCKCHDLFSMIQTIIDQNRPKKGCISIQAPY